MRACQNPRGVGRGVQMHAKAIARVGELTDTTLTQTVELMQLYDVSADVLLARIRVCTRLHRIMHKARKNLNPSI